MRITGLQIIERPHPWATGDKLMAFFDVEFAGIRLASCTLVKAKRGLWLAQAPRGNTKAEGRRLIDIVDPSIKEAMTAAALQAYRALGGTVD